MPEGRDGNKNEIKNKHARTTTYANEQVGTWYLGSWNDSYSKSREASKHGSVN